MIRTLFSAEIVSSSPRITPAFSASGATSRRASPTAFPSSRFWMAHLPKNGRSSTLVFSALVSRMESSTHLMASWSLFSPLSWSLSTQVPLIGILCSPERLRYLEMISGSSSGILSLTIRRPNETCTPSKPICAASGSASGLAPRFRFQSVTPMGKLRAAPPAGGRRGRRAPRIGAGRDD